MQRDEFAAAKVAWAATFPADPIDLRGLPSGSDYRAFGGKVLISIERYISIPIGLR